MLVDEMLQACGCYNNDTYITEGRVLSGGIYRPSRIILSLVLRFCSGAPPEIPSPLSVAHVQLLVTTADRMEHKSGVYGPHRGLLLGLKLGVGGWVGWGAGLIQFLSWVQALSTVTTPCSGARFEIQKSDAKGISVQVPRRGSCIY